MSVAHYMLDKRLFGIQTLSIVSKQICDISKIRLEQHIIML